MEGKLLRVNLSSGKIQKEDIPKEYIKDYLGGAGLAARYLYDEIPVDNDVFSENNKLFFSVGPLNGGAFPTSGRYNVSCRSPLTGIWLDSSSSGKFGYYFRKAGYLGIIIEGKSEKPVYLFINNNRAEIRDASHIWGKTISESIKMIQDENEMPKSSVAAIGPSGEKLVKIACIINDSARAVGRGGAGALMGSKKLKAILVSGDDEIENFQRDEWKTTVKEIAEKIHSNPVSGALKAYGTAVGMASAANTGDAPTKNWQLGTWDKYTNISGPYMSQTILKKHSPECHACPIQCSRYVEVKDGPYKMEGSGPEYETLGAFGSLCLNDNLESIAYINMICNEYGVDTISAGSAVAFAMEAFEKGNLKSEEFDGLSMQWGDIDSIIGMLWKIINREGIGELLGNGVRHAAQQIGNNSDEFAVHVKGLELPMHDPRAFFGYAPTYATSPRGACHCHGYNGRFDGRAGIPEAGVNEVTEIHSLTGKGLLSKAVQDFSTAIHCSIVCLFTSYAMTPTDLAKSISSATGEEYNASDILRVGERTFNLQRAFNNRYGISSKDDTLPKRVLTSTIGGPNEGIVPNIMEQLKEYYEARGWNSDGKPSREKLKELNLDFVIEDLYK